MEERFSRMLGAITEEELNRLRASKVCVAGCGGLGGYVIEYLARMGVGEIVAIDPDAFDESNLNRQILCTEENLNKSKVLEAAQRVRHINSELKVIPFAEALNEENAERLLCGCSLAIDALDSADARRVLARACGKLGLTLVHGAINGWRAQISVLPPCSDAFDFMYPADYKDKEKPASLSFTPALAASLEAAEATKLLCGREPTLSGRLLLIDLQTMEFTTVKL